MERFLHIERETLQLRLVAALGAAAGLFVHQGKLSLFLLLFFSLAYFSYVIYALVLRYFVLPRFTSFSLIYAMIVIDVVALLGIMQFIGGINTALIVLFPVFIVYYSIHLGYLGSFATATAATVGLAISIAVLGQAPGSERDLVFAVTMFYVVASISGYLGQKGIKEQAEKEALQEMLNVEVGARNLLEATRALTSTLELKALLDGITRIAPQVTGLPWCVAMLLDEKKQTLVAHAGNLDVQELGLHEITDLVEPLGDGSLAKQALDTASPLAVSDMEELQDLHPPPAALQAKSVLVIPLISEERAIGVLYAYGETSGHSVTEQQLRLAQGFGDLAAIAIANARRYESAQHRVATLVGQLGSAVRRLERLREPEKRRAFINLDGLEIDIQGHRATLQGEPVELSPTEFKLLLALAENPGVAVNQEVLFRKTWGDVYQGRTNVVDVYIYRLRKKLREDTSSPRRIVTVRGIGYKLARAN